MSKPSDQAAQSSTGGLAFLLAFAASPMLVVLVIGVDSLNPTAVGLGSAFVVMLLAMGWLLALTLWMLADCREISASRRRLDSAPGRSTSAPAASLPVAVQRPAI